MITRTHAHVIFILFDTLFFYSAAFYELMTVISALNHCPTRKNSPKFEHPAAWCIKIALAKHFQAEDGIGSLDNVTLHARA